MKIFNIEIGRRKVRDEYMGDAHSSFVSRWARPPSMNTAEWLEMFSKSPRLAVVDRIASDLANIGGKLLYVNGDGTETEITNHRFLDFMEQPNPLYEMTSSAIWRLHEIYLMLVGESFFLIERDEHDRPIELWNVPPHWVKMTPYLGSPSYTITSPGGLTMTVPVDDMFVMKQLNPLDPFLRGLGIAESIADEVEIDEYAAKFQKRFFYNDATPPVVFLMPDATDEQRNAFMARWNQKHKGVENSHRAAAFSGNVDVKELGSSNGKELGFVESRIAMRDAVLEHFGVPREIMGITENSNRATADAAQYIYAKNVLTPRIKMREEAINKQLLPLFGDNLVWRFDPVIPYDKDFDKAKALDAYNAGLITKNEARELLDLPDIEGGSIYKISASDLFLHENDDAAKITQSRSEQLPLSFGFNGFGTKARPMGDSAALQEEDSALSRNESAFEAAVNRHFAEQQKAVAAALGNTAKADMPTLLSQLEEYLLPDGSFDPDKWAELPEIEQQKLTKAIADGLLDWKEEAKKLMQMFQPIWKEVYDAGVEISEDRYGLYSIDKPEFVTPAIINGGKRIVNIESTTRDKISGIIARGISEGISQVKLKNEIQDVMKSSSARAKLIARQETMTSLATGQFDMMKSAGATKKTWHHRPQKNPRDGSRGPNHVSMNGETIPINEVFSNGLRYPRDPHDGRAEEVINCRCYLTYSGWDEAPRTQNVLNGNVGISETGEVSQNGWISALTEEEKEALHVNTGPDNRGIQKMLRGEITGNDKLRKYASDVERALDKAVLSKNLQVKRGSDIFGLKGFLDLPEDLTYREITEMVETAPEKIIGKKVSDDGFLSTSLPDGRSFRGVARYYLNLGKGTHAAYVTDFADGLGTEKEILVQRKTEFVVTNVSIGVDEDMNYDIIQVFLDTVAQ